VYFPRLGALRHMSEEMSGWHAGAALSSERTVRREDDARMKTSEELQTQRSDSFMTPMPGALPEPPSGNSPDGEEIPKCKLAFEEVSTRTLTRFDTRFSDSGPRAVAHVLARRPAHPPPALRSRRSAAVCADAATIETGPAEGWHKACRCGAIGCACAQVRSPQSALCRRVPSMRRPHSARLRCD